MTVQKSAYYTDVYFEVDFGKRVVRCWKGRMAHKASEYTFYTVRETARRFPLKRAWQELYEAIERGEEILVNTN